MSRPRKFDDRSQTTLRIGSALLARLAAEADRRVVSRNLIVEAAISEWLSVNENRDAAATRSGACSTLGCALADGHRGQCAGSDGNILQRAE